MWAQRFFFTWASKIDIIDVHKACIGVATLIKVNTSHELPTQLKHDHSLLWFFSSSHILIIFKLHGLCVWANNHVGLMFINILIPRKRVRWGQYREEIINLDMGSLRSSRLIIKSTTLWWDWQYVSTRIDNHLEQRVGGWTISLTENLLEMQYRRFIAGSTHVSRIIN